MKTITLANKTLVNKNTRANSRTLAKYLRLVKGIAAKAPAKKDDSGKWDVSASVQRSKKFYVVNKGIAAKANMSSI